MTTEAPLAPAPEPATSAAPVVVHFDDVHMVFPGGLRRPVHALRGMTIEIGAGAVVGFLGPNGSGKTTAISCLLGLLRPQRGGVSLWGKPIVADLPSGGDQRIGVLLEDTRLPPFLSVRAALAAVCRVRGLRARRLALEVERVAHETRIEALLERRVATLSKGQARRVGLAAALISDPPLLVLDEPSAGRDVGGREEFNQLVRALRHSSRTLLIASHLLSDVESTCTHIAIIQDGRIRVYESAERLLREARQRCSEKDIHVDDAVTTELERLGVRFETSRYPGLVRLLVAEPEHELIGRLAAARIVPTRIEPRVNLVSVYVALTRGAVD